MRGGSSETYQAYHATEKGDHVDSLFCVTDLGEPGIERQDDQERCQGLRAGQQDPQFAQEIGQVTIFRFCARLV